MKAKHLLFSIFAVFIASVLLIGAALADDSIMFRKNISKTPDAESEKAGLFFMPFTLPLQASDGTVLESIDYVTEDGSIAYTTTTAKPLIAVYIDDIGGEEMGLASITGPESITGGIGFGKRDAFVAFSFDDGTTWKNVNLSRAADLSSFTLANGTDYPGDTHSMVHQVGGNRVMAAWISRYCDEGNPTYTRVADQDVIDDAYVTYMKETYGLSDLYLLDIWGVTGTQKSVDYEEQGFPEVGEIPYGCVWTARGTLIAGDDPSTTDVTEAHYMVFTKAERLTSGVRDPNRLEVDCIKGAGCAITWQEDPEGLRPGQGLGPGEGWSGAIVNAKTDVWYSYISWEDFNLVDVDGDITTYSETDTLPIEEYVVDVTDGTQPKPAVPMSIPIRLTDNNMCWADNPNIDPYCLADIETETEAASEYGTIVLDAPDKDLCDTTIVWTNPQGVTKNICQTDDLRALNGRVGASRPRLSLQPYTKPDGTAGAWAMVIYEETKAQGDVIEDDTLDEIDIGKNIWYHTFDLFHPVPVRQGGMINQPVAFNPETGAQAAEGEFLTFTDEFDNVVYETEIARRASPVYQPVGKIGATRTAAFLIYKQGILNQGGPADVLARRVVVPAVDDPDTPEIEGTFDPASMNPYLYEYMVCDNWIIPPGTETTSADYNPNYVQGLCGAPAVNFSATTTDICYTEASELGGEPSQDCVDDFPWTSLDQESTYPKVSEWHQTVDNLDDQTWENPFDVAKGHRGFLDGDFLMAMYAWSPNWKSNSVGNDKYNLYVRRSFDGGQTWTTTPGALGGTGIDGDDPANPWCENYGTKEDTRWTECFDYAAGEFEPGRNVSQLIGTKITILDPRYSPSGGLKKWVVAPYVDEYLDTSEYLIEDYDLTRDPSKFFMIYETGDNTTVDVGEAIPLDLYYSRATVYGDVWEWEYVEDASVPEYRWPWVENQKEDLSGEAAMLANPSGDFMYTDWNQWREEILEDGHELIYDSDTWFRRFFYNRWVEAAPSVSFLSALPTTIDIEDELTLAVTARDNDQFGEGPEIVEYEWTLDGVVVSTESTFNAPPRTLSKGWHGFSVRAKDHEGHWSNAVTFSINVTHYSHIYLPVIIRP